MPIWYLAHLCVICIPLTPLETQMEECRFLLILYKSISKEWEERMAQNFASHPTTSAVAPDFGQASARCTATFPPCPSSFSAASCDLPALTGASRMHAFAVALAQSRSRSGGTAVPSSRHPLHQMQQQSHVHAQSPSQPLFFPNAPSTPPQNPVVQNVIGSHSLLKDMLNSPVRP